MKLPFVLAACFMLSVEATFERTVPSPFVRRCNTLATATQEEKPETIAKAFLLSARTQTGLDEELFEKLNDCMFHRDQGLRKVANVDSPRMDREERVAFLHEMADTQE